MFKFTQVALCLDSVADHFHHADPNQLNKTLKGNLSLLLEISTGMLMFSIEDLQYGINPNDQVLYDDHNPDFKLILCLNSDPNNCWLLKINDNVELVFLVLSQRCKLIHRDAARVIIQETETVSEGVQKKEEISVQGVEGQKKDKEGEEEGQSTESILIQSSKMLGKGLALAGKALSRGLQKLGKMISKKIEPSESIEVSENSKKLIDTSVKASGKILEFSSEQFALIFRMAKKETINLVQYLESSEKGQQLKKKEEYGFAKRGIMTGLHVIGNIYEGVTEGISEASVGLAKGSKEVIAVKYGQDAGDASMGIVESAKNVARIYKVPRNEAKKMLKPSENELDGPKKIEPAPTP